MMVDFSLPTPDQNVLKPRNIIIDSTVESLSYYDYERISTPQGLFADLLGLELSVTKCDKYDKS